MAEVTLELLKRCECYVKLTLKQLHEIITQHPYEYVYIEMTTEKYGVELVFPVNKFVAMAIIREAMDRLPENKNEKVAANIKENNLYFGPF